MPELKLLEPDDHRGRGHNEPLSKLVDLRPTDPRMRMSRQCCNEAVAGNKKPASEHLGLALRRISCAGSAPRPTIAIERDGPGACGISVEEPMAYLMGDREPSEPRACLELGEMAIVEDHELIPSQEGTEYALSVILEKGVPEEAEAERVEQRLGVETGLEPEAPPKVGRARVEHSRGDEWHQRWRATVRR